MKLKFTLALLLIFLSLNFVIAQGKFCVDFDAPSPPSNLTVTGEVFNITLNWDAATDTPACSGIDYYIISRNGASIGNTSSTILTFIDTANLSEGNYNYTVFAVDKAGQNQGASIENEVVLTKKGGTIYVGGGSSSHTCYGNWVCEDWSMCIDGFLTRNCTDTRNCGTLYKRPSISEACDLTLLSTGSKNELPEQQELDFPENKGFVPRMTGAVTGFAQSGTGIIVLIVLVGLAGAFIGIKRYRK